MWIKEGFRETTRFYNMKRRTQGFLGTFMTTAILLSAEGTSQASSEHQSRDLYGVLNTSVLIPGKAAQLGRNGLIQWEYNSGRGPSLSQFLPILDYYSETDRLVVSDSYEGRVECNWTDGSLLLHSLWWSDQGFYRLKVDLDESKTKMFRLIMNVPLSEPSISSSSSRLGSTVEMRCVAFGHVTRYVWQKDGENLPPGHRLSSANSCLTIRNAKRSDCGQYTCTLENQLASKSSSYHLVIYGVSTMNNVTLFSAVVSIVLVLTDWPFVVWQHSVKMQRANGTHSWQKWTVKLILSGLSAVTLLIGQTVYLLEDGTTATVVVMIFLTALVLVLMCSAAIAICSKLAETLRDSSLPLDKFPLDGRHPVLKFILLGTCDCFIIGAALILVIEVTQNNNSVCGSKTLNPILIYGWLLLSCLVPATLIVTYIRYVRLRMGSIGKRKQATKCDPITKNYTEEDNQTTYTSLNNNTISALLGSTSSDIQRAKIPFGS